MKIFKKLLLLNQSGMSLVTILASLGLGLAGITYLMKDTLPRLQNEKKRIDSQLAYRIFISSVNDYMVHGIRERWCINYNNGTSDLLLSNYCSSKSSMEDIVTYPGNLERILWNSETIGTELNSPPSIENANKILALNFLRHESNKTSVKLTEENIAPRDGKLSFRLTEQILKDMNESHPLFIMSRKIMDCVNYVDVEVFQVTDFANLATGDEKKIGVRIKADIKKTKITCLAVQNAESVSYYTFYPRRLHTFSLVKYGDLDGSDFNEFHGPVYVAGNFILPKANADKEKTSVFYNSLTLGIFNGGSSNKTIYPGRVINTDKSSYTFAERAHPYLSKQDNYEGFRGFLGGLKLDSTEDKGFHNLFDHSSSSAANLAQLEACIEDNQSQLNKSRNASSDFLYKTLEKSSGGTKIMVSFNQKNRFALSEENPAVINSPQNNKFNKSTFLFAAKNTNTDALAEIGFSTEIKDSSNQKVKEDYIGTLGDGSSLELNLDFEKFKVTSKDLSQFKENLQKVTRTNFNNLIASNVIAKSEVYKQFEFAVRELIKKCDKRVIPDCIVLDYTIPQCNGGEDIGGGSTTGGGSGRGSSTGRNFEQVEEEEEEEVEDNDRGPDNCVGGAYSFEVNRVNQAKNALLLNLETLKNFQDQKNTSLEVNINKVAPYRGQTVLNQRNIEFKFSPGWREYFKLIYGELSNFEVTITPYHNGPARTLKLRLDMMSSQEGNNPRIISRRNLFSNEIQDIKSSWNYTKTNNSAAEPTPLIELECPQGMSMADWDLDMSPSTNFSWNYANTPAGAFVDTNDHQQASPIIFHPGTPPLEGHAYSNTKSVVEDCIIPADRTHVYGFYVCNKITIKERTSPLYMVGTFIVSDLDIPKGLNTPIHWYSIWDTKATDLIMTDLNSEKSNCNSISDLTSKTWKDVVSNPHIAATVDSCGPLDLITNGPNNFSWTTVDPDVGIANAGDVMTSQKVNRIQKWIIREESRTDLIR